MATHFLGYFHELKKEIIVTPVQTRKEGLREITEEQAEIKMTAIVQTLGSRDFRELEFGSFSNGDIKVYFDAEKCPVEYNFKIKVFENVFIVKKIRERFEGDFSICYCKKEVA